MTVHFPIPRRIVPPKLVIVGAEARALRRAADASLLAMSSVVLRLRELGRHEEADALTRQRDEWFRATTEAVHATEKGPQR